MQYYEVYVADNSYKRVDPLTYAYAGRLEPGQLVRVPLKRRAVLAVVVAAAPKPSFATKPAMLVEGLPPLPLHLLQLARWMTGYYATGIGTVMQQLLPSSLPKKLPEADTNAPSESAAPAALPPLTTAQEAALKSIDSPGTYIVHGDTGTGKTRIYLELALRAAGAQRSSIILTPEIGLTPQLARSFQETFGMERVIVTHSQLTDAQRTRLWVRMLRATEPLVIIGPRSALFSPLRDIGVIVLDEAHESSYKQEQAPHYQTATVAAQLASSAKAPLVLGSATPAINDYYMATSKQRPILRLREAAKQQSAGAVAMQVVDLKRRECFSRQPHLSDQLVAAIGTAMTKGEQSLLFLNRRGTARTMLCEQCGWQAICRNCDLPLTYHGDQHRLRCHTCGIIAPAPSSCPECGSVRIQLRAVGTKAIVDEVQRAFPEARIMRFDKDNTKDERLEVHYGALHTGDVDIIIGTQLIAKGLDLPHLAAVGVIIADTSLYFPDFTAQERTYQLLRQVIGRVGRGHRDATVVVQTYDPDNPVLKAALSNDWDGFYAAELDERKLFLFPPFCFLLKLTCRRASSAVAERAASDLAQKLRDSGRPVIVEGPAPSFHEKAAGKYQWQVIVKAKARAELTDIIHALPANWNFDIDPGNLL